MARFSMPYPAVNRSDLLDNTLEDHYSVASSTTQGSEVDPGSVPPGNSGNSNGSVAEVIDTVAGSVKESSNNRGMARAGILRGKWAKEKTAGATIQAPSHNSQQQFPHGYPVPVYPPGMMPMRTGMKPSGMMHPGMMHPGMMPMQPGAAMPGRMPYIPPYYDWAFRRGGCYDYACGHPDIQTVTLESSSGCDYSLSTSDSSCSTLLCTEPLANLVLNTVDSLKRSVDVVMDYGEELCDTKISGGHSVGSRRSTSSLATRSTPEDHAELLDKIDKLYKLVTEKEASGEANMKTKDLNPLEALDESAITHRSGSGLVGVGRSLSADAEDNAPGEAMAKATKRGDNVEELTSLFSDNQLGKEHKTNKVTSIQEESDVNEAVETEADFMDSKNILTKLRRGRSRSCERLKKFIPVKTSQAKEEKVVVQKEPAVDSLGFPLATSNDIVFNASSWESDFSSGNPFAGEGTFGGLSPVSVATSLKPRSCAWCGLGGSNGKDVKKLKLCSACRSTYYCSSECQSKDWINGHSKTCQVVANVD
jgi:hypothetical protein